MDLLIIGGLLFFLFVFVLPVLYFLTAVLRLVATIQIGRAGVEYCKRMAQAQDSQQTEAGDAKRDS